MNGVHDFGDAESLALDDDRLGFEDEPPVARSAAKPASAASHQELKFEDESDETFATEAPKRNTQRIVLLVLIGGVVLVMLGKPIAQKFFMTQPIPDTGQAAPMQAMEPARPLPTAQQQLQPPAAAAPALVQPAQAAPTTLSPATTAPATASPLVVEASAPEKEQALLAPSAGKAALGGKAVAVERPADGDASQPKAAAPEETMEAKVARLEKEVKTLTARNRQLSAAKSTRSGHAERAQQKTRGGDGASKVLGMSATSVWVRKANGSAAELRVGDHFKNGEVIQSIDQQAQVVETDRGRYKVSF
ncbi:hypothetical protein ACPRNU_13605 [Chromobacterium vaccinii]|uniref:hypothetical protein n=1 Tax=Chromobacterium vaccinii TaxID=1108595 RepID=UPI003C735FDC